MSIIFILQADKLNQKTLKLTCIPKLEPTGTEEHFQKFDTNIMMPN